MEFFIDIVKGMFIGIANVIPGVSGGTMAVSLGIYDKLIESVSGLFSHLKKSIFTLLPILIGCIIGLAGFSFMIEYLLAEHTFVTCMTFVGLILGGIPMLLRSAKRDILSSNTSIHLSGILCFLFFFLFSILLPVLGSDQEILKTFQADPATILILFIIGIIASATMVVPGVSGSLVLMILGYYYGIISSVKDMINAIKDVSITGMIHGFSILIPFGVGVLLGIFLVSKLITWLFKKHAMQTYCSILGLIAASPFAIFYNTGLFSKLSSLTVVDYLSGLILALAGILITCFLGEK